MRFFITGGTGHLGWWLIKKLSGEGKEIHALVRNPERCGHLLLPGVQLVQGDITDAESVKKGMQGCTHVFHLAAQAKVWDKDPTSFDRINEEGTRNVLQAALDLGIIKVVYCSTAGLHGPSDDEPVTEKTVRKIPYFNAYEITKAAAMEQVKKFEQLGLQVTVVSPTRVFGPIEHREPESVDLIIYHYLYKNWKFIPGSGKEIGNYVYVKDVANGMVLAMEKGLAGEEYILGGDNFNMDHFFTLMAGASGIHRKMYHIPVPVLKILTFFQMLKPLFGKEPYLTPDWTAKVKLNWRIDISKAVSELGYTTTPVETAMHETVQQFLKDIKRKG